MDKKDKKTVSGYKLHKKLFAAGVAGAVAINALSWASVGFCDWYMECIFPVWLNTYARFTSMVPVSVGEIMLAAAVAVTLFGIAFFVWNLANKGKYNRGAGKFGAFYAWTALAVCYVMTFNCFIMYHASSFSEKYMEDGGGVMVAGASGNIAAQAHMERKGYTQGELAALRDYIVKKCNSLEKEIMRDEGGTAYYDGDLIDASRRAMAALGTEYGQLEGFYVTPKYLACSAFFSQQYIMGYYFPFSMEANINSIMYITNVAPTVCHELAHTKGFIFEDDANMIGFLACVKSDDTFLQYCGYLSVLNYVNNDFYDSIGGNMKIYKSHVRIDDRVADDNIFLTREEWQTVEKKAVIKTSTVKSVSGSFTDTVLKLNGVQEGMKQYDNVVGLLLRYYDGELF